MSLRRTLLVRKGASIAEDACVGEAVFIGRLSRLKIGSSSFIGKAEMMLHGQVAIGSCVCINDGVVILTASHDLRDPEWKQWVKPVTIEDYAWIATGATILPGVRIGRGAVVGASAVVSKDVPAFGLAVGNPAVVREDRRVHEFSYSPVRFLAFQEAWLGGTGGDRT